MQSVPVRIIGAGLLGASLALRFRQRGVHVSLEDSSPSALALARDLGAGEIATQESPAPGIVFVATPPDVAGVVAGQALLRFPGAIISDVASVKASVLEEVRAYVREHAEGAEYGEAISRYVGSHPMAGRERSGAIAADAELFVGRPWVIMPHSEIGEENVGRIQQIALDMGAYPIVMEAAEHDASVALVSHAPQLVSSLMASRLRGCEPQALELAGQGLRDLTRIAHSDPGLWARIVAANSAAIADVLEPFAEELAGLVTALREGAGNSMAPGVHAATSRVLAHGNEGVARIPGKHGGPPRIYAEVFVLVPDRPGELGKLFSDIGAIGVNIEDFQLEHSHGQSVGRALLLVDPSARRTLARGLEERSWQVVMEGNEEA